MENGPVEIVDLPINSMVIFQFAMLSYQRVSFLMIYLLMTNLSMAMLQDGLKSPVLLVKPIEI